MPLPLPLPPMVVLARPAIYKGACVIYKGGCSIYKGACSIYKGGCSIYKGACAIYKGACVAGTITLNEGREVLQVRVTNTGDRPIQVGSHYHFLETNGALDFDRD